MAAAVLCKMHLQLWLLAAGIAWNVLGCQAGCNVCSPISRVACTSKTTFQFCNENEQIGTIYSCPAGTFCTDNPQICESDASLSACTDCGKCNEQKTFACVGVKTFALCMGSSTPSDMIFDCDDGLVCQLDKPQICVPNEIGATCSKKNDEDTLNEYCRTSYNSNIRYPLPNDQTCTSFVYCEYYTMDLWKGRIIECPEDTPFFNARTSSCGTHKPTGKGCV